MYVPFFCVTEVNAIRRDWVVEELIPRFPTTEVPGVSKRHSQRLRLLRLDRTDPCTRAKRIRDLRLETCSRMTVRRGEV